MPIFIIFNEVQGNSAELSYVLVYGALVLFSGHDESTAQCRAKCQQLAWASYGFGFNLFSFWTAHCHTNQTVP